MKVILHLLILATTIAVAFLGFRAWQWGLDLVQSQTFYYDAVTEGEITRSKVDDSGDHLSPGLRYVFEVNDHTVEGSRYRINLIEKKEYSDAREIVKSFEPGDKVNVYYRVDGNGEVLSVLNPHASFLAHLLYVGGLCVSFSIITFYLAVVILRPIMLSRVWRFVFGSKEMDSKERR